MWSLLFSSSAYFFRKIRVDLNIDIIRQLAHSSKNQLTFWKAQKTNNHQSSFAPVFFFPILWARWNSISAAFSISNSSLRNFPTTSCVSQLHQQILENRRILGFLACWTPLAYFVLKVSWFLLYFLCHSSLGSQFCGWRIPLTCWGRLHNAYCTGYNAGKHKRLLFRSGIRYKGKFQTNSTPPPPPMWVGQSFFPSKCWRRWNVFSRRWQC